MKVAAAVNALVGIVFLASCTDALAPDAAALGCYYLTYDVVPSGWPPANRHIRLRADYSDTSLVWHMVSPSPDPSGTTESGVWRLEGNALLMRFVAFEEVVDIRFGRVRKNLPAEMGRPDYVGKAEFQPDYPSFFGIATLTRTHCED